MAETPLPNQFPRGASCGVFPAGRFPTEGMLPPGSNMVSFFHAPFNCLYYYCHHPPSCYNCREKGGETVNKYGLSILKYAYSKYQESGSIHYSVMLSGNADDIVGLRNAIRNLEEEKYIENVSQSELNASFDLSTVGIEYMRSYGEL